MQRIVECTLKDGSRMELHCLRFPGSKEIPEQVRELFGAPQGCGWGLRQPDGKRYLNVSGWERYYFDVFTGVSADECTDYLYAALVGGRPAGRMWFGFSNRSRCGNFGNVETLPEFRRRGIMAAMLQVLRKDFLESDALFISCGAAETAAPAYAAIGFERLLGPENHAMALFQPGAGTFAEILKKAYGDNRNAVIRSGRRGDRFDVDKLLAYAPEFAFQRLSYPPLIREHVPDYLHAFQRVLPERSALSVVESSSGVCAGYAWAEKNLPGVSLVTALLHPGFCGYLEALLEHVTRGLDDHLLLVPGSSCQEYRNALLDAGFFQNGCGFWEGTLHQLSRH